MNNSKQYKNNHPCIVYAKMTTYGKQLHLGTCIGTLLISSGGGGGGGLILPSKSVVKKAFKGSSSS